MQIFIPMLLLAIVSHASFAQEMASLPKKEFTISLSQNALEIRSGETKDITVTLQRSRGYSKLNAALNLSSSLPDGVNISFEPSTGVIENTIARITVNENAKPGNYMIVVNCTINHKNKGTMLKLTVKSPADLSTGL